MPNLRPKGGAVCNSGGLGLVHSRLYVRVGTYLQGSKFCGGRGKCLVGVPKKNRPRRGFVNIGTKGFKGTVYISIKSSFQGADVAHYKILLKGHFTTNKRRSSSIWTALKCQIVCMILDAVTIFHRLYPYQEIFSTAAFRICNSNTWDWILGSPISIFGSGRLRKAYQALAGVSALEQDNIIRLPVLREERVELGLLLVLLLLLLLLILLNLKHRTARLLSRYGGTGLVLCR